MYLLTSIALETYDGMNKTAVKTRIWRDSVRIGPVYPVPVDWIVGPLKKWGTRERNDDHVAVLKKKFVKSATINTGIVIAQDEWPIPSWSGIWIGWLLSNTGSIEEEVQKRQHHLVQLFNDRIRRCQSG